MNTLEDKFMSKFINKTVTFLGIGISNTPMILKFAEKGICVSARDKKSESALGDRAKELKNKGVNLILGEDYLKNINEDYVFRSPGFSPLKEELQEASKRGSIITSEMEQFFEYCPGKIIGVTGSDGKTTTTTLVKEILTKQGYKVWLGGNIGKPLLPDLGLMSDKDYAVVELSSFQLMDMKKSPDIAIVTNVAPNHLDYHKDMEEYIQAKANIFSNQTADGKLVLNMDNDITRAFVPKANGRVLTFSRAEKVSHGCYVKDSKDIIYVDKDGNEHFVMNKYDIFIEGEHNVEDYMAAICAVYDLVDKESIDFVAKNFKGVEHRNEFVRELDGVKYFNNSIASNPTRVYAALNTYKNMIIIAGGYDKKIPFDEFGRMVCKKVKKIILMGNTADKIYQAIVNAAEYKEHKLPIYRVSNMEEAVNKSREIAEKGDIVSLSPACASFDLYPNFEIRGNHFKEIVNNLK